MRRQKHYTSEEMIIKDIDLATRRMNRLFKKSAEMLIEADKLTHGNAGDREKGRQMYGEAEKKHTQAERIQNIRLKKLQNTLVAFRTMLLPGVCTDNSVVLQKS